MQLGCSWPAAVDEGPFGHRPRVDEPHACDEAAAHPADRNRMAAGIELDSDIVPGIAISACQEAVAVFPDEPRFRLQLARAFLSAGKPEQAIPELELAAKAGYAPALHYLGQAALDYYWSSRDPGDAEMAREYFEAAAAEFPPAAQMLAGFELDLSGFEAPNIVLDLYLHRFDRLNDARIVAAEYGLGMQEFFTTAFNPTENYCPAILARRAIEYDLEDAAAGNAQSGPERILYNGGIWLATKLGSVLDPVWQGDVERYRKHLRNLGARDAQHLAETAGCSSLVAERIYSGLSAFSEQRRPLREYVDLLLDGSYKELFSERLPEAPSEPMTAELSQKESDDE
ncbi:MAG: hypothetical protein H6509_02855 [Bryobacterales bacterium]|nr:hypothetical protein [Bryobacterales bacterium]